MSESEDSESARVEELLALALASVPDQPLPVSTYRLQFHAGFTFADATAIVPYLAALGISHCYASPFLKARSGSLHGYDITDHAHINPEIGTPDDYTAWTQTLREHGLGQIVDVVPNHMAVTGNENRWWNDVLESGPASPYAEFFDIDWAASSRPELHGRVLLPVLGEPYGKVLEAGQLTLAYEAGEFSIRYFSHRFPVAPRSYGFILQQSLEALERAQGAEAPATLEYHSIVTAIKNLPPRTETDPARLTEIHREKEVIKRRLAALTSENPHVAAFIDEAVKAINGRPGDARSFDGLEELLDEQVYRLAYWRVASDEINYRRFFDVNELAALSMEKPEVFTATHELIMRLVRERSVAGLRIDHPDGLYDPAQYLHRLQEEFLVGRAREAFEAQPAFRAYDWQTLEKPLRALLAEAHLHGARPCPWPLFVVVEKILGADEALRADWPTCGTTGYEFLNALNGLFVDGRAGPAFSRLYYDWIGDDTPFPELVYQKKTLILQIALSSELQMLTHQLDRLAQRKRWSRDFTTLSLRRGLREVIACFPVYRSYVTGTEMHEADRRYILRAVRRAMVRNPAQSAALFQFLRDTLLLLPFRDEPIEPDYQAEQRRFVGKFQQVTAPVMAKGVEDTCFYIYNRLLSLNEVGGNPEQFGVAPSSLHAIFQQRQAQWPYSFSATSTHDTKRSEDVRARLNVLSEMPAEWAECVGRWSRLNERHRITLEDMAVPDRNEEYFIYQTLLGAWPVEPFGPDEYRHFGERIQSYMLKALHEAKVHTSWINPNAPYDDAIRTFIARILDPEANQTFLDDLRPMQKRVNHFGMINSLAQTLVKITAPGVPDLYQGTELWSFHLVDPDNRGAVDYAIRQRLLQDLSERCRSPRADRRGLARELTAHKDDGRIKMYLTWQALQCRRDHPGLFTTGDYIAVETRGPGASHAFAFMRRQGSVEALVVVPRLLATLAHQGDSGPWDASLWRETELIMPTSRGRRRWRNILTGEDLDEQRCEGKATLSIAHALASFPVGLFLAAS